ncbi:MAG: tyrosine-type recombinase/integrase [Chloroflexi bacterium]|nr:tyrosine-type recombinase/integrase [Chloroflexota bacterium]
MLKRLYPQSHVRYLSLPVLGPIADEFDDWLMGRGSTYGTRIIRISATAHIDEYLRKRGRTHLWEVTREDLLACWRDHRRNNMITGASTVLRAFLEQQGLLPVAAPEPPPFWSHVGPYATYLTDVRGFSRSTLHSHLATATRFLEHLKQHSTEIDLSKLSISDLESFIVVEGQRLGRGSMQHVVAHLRGFLRFLVMKGQLRPGLEVQVDTPKRYRLEQLPRALPWETVGSLLDAIDRKTAVGRRDFAMFSMMATYGLRASDIVTLPLDAIHWRKDEIWINQRKTGQLLTLPLTDAVGGALLEYLRKARPQFPYRQLFLSVRAPVHPVGNTALGVAFGYWVRRSGVEAPHFGPGCLRHSYAVHLLRQGFSVKTIGDLLGHRLAESTCVYLRLAIDDLREVALSIPRAGDQEAWL